MTWKAGQSLAALVALAAIGQALYLLVTADTLVTHMLAHVLLVDVAAAGIVLAVPRERRRTLAAAIDRRAAASKRWVSLGARLVRSPVALLGVWTLTLTLLMLPAGHQWSTSGAGRALEPALLLLVGLAFWRVTFDEHAQRPFHEAVLRGGLAWWGRHALAMVGRVAILPAILALWFWPPGSYQGAGAVQQELAAGVVLGAEMIIFGAAFVLFFILLVVLDREPAPSARHGEVADGV
jgi:cytochrome c oxidase assembly factor CtaG